MYIRSVKLALVLSILVVSVGSTLSRMGQSTSTGTVAGSVTDRDRRGGGRRRGHTDRYRDQHSA